MVAAMNENHVVGSGTVSVVTGSVTVSPVVGIGSVTTKNRKAAQSLDLEEFPIDSFHQCPES